jgi:hypothetical protein
MTNAAKGAMAAVITRPAMTKRMIPPHPNDLIRTSPKLKPTKVSGQLKSGHQRGFLSPQLPVFSAEIDVLSLESKVTTRIRDSSVHVNGNRTCEAGLKRAVESQKRSLAMLAVVDAIVGVVNKRINVA